LKKSVFFLLLLAAAVINISCSQKKLSFAEETTSMQKTIFQQARYSKTGYKDSNYPNRLYYPEALDKFLFRHTFVNGEFCYFIELYMPEIKGILDTSAFVWDAYDDGEWVEDLVFSLEEERLGTELYELLENTLEMPSPFEAEESGADSLNKESEEAGEQTEEKAEENKKASDSNLKEEDPFAKYEAIPEVEPVESRILDAKNRLKIMEYNSEVFIPISKKNNSIMVHFYGERAVRYFYDNNYKLFKKEIWKITDIKNSKIETNDFYYYENPDGSLSKREIISDDYSTILEYDEKGNIKNTENYVIINEEKSLRAKTSWLYDEKGRLISEEKIENQYEDNEYLKSLVKKELYEYRPNTDTAEAENLLKYEYYENDQLKIQSLYSAPGSYSTTIHFERNYSVTSYYENNKKVRDVYYVDGIVRRSKLYE